MRGIRVHGICPFAEVTRTIVCSRAAVRVALGMAHDRWVPGSARGGLGAGLGGYLSKDVPAGVEGVMDEFEAFKKFQGSKAIGGTSGPTLDLPRRLWQVALACSSLCPFFFPRFSSRLL